MIENKLSFKIYIVRKRYELTENTYVRLNFNMYKKTFKNIV